MDPQRTLTDLLEAIAEEDRRTAIICLGQLRDWLSIEGYFPKVWISETTPETTYIIARHSNQKDTNS